MSILNTLPMEIKMKLVFLVNDGYEEAEIPILFCNFTQYFCSLVDFKEALATVELEINSFYVYQQLKNGYLAEQLIGYTGNTITIKHANYEIIIEHNGTILKNVRAIYPGTLLLLDVDLNETFKELVKLINIEEINKKQKGELR